MKNKFSTYIIIVLLSIGIWFYVTMSKEYIYELQIPITITTNNKDSKTTNIIDSLITFKLKGEGWRLLSIYFTSKQTISIDLGDDTTRTTIDVMEYFNQNDIISSKVQILNIFPRVLKIKYEKIITKKVKVIPNYSINLQDGYILANEPKIIPESIVVKGRESIIRKINSISTQKIFFSDVKESFTQDAELNFPKGSSASINSVNVSFDIQQMVDLEIRDVPIEIKNNTKLFQVTFIPEKVDVKIRGGINNLANLKNKVNAYVYLEELLNDTTSYIIPKFNLPDNVKIIEINPTKVRYLIRKN